MVGPVVWARQVHLGPIIDTASFQELSRMKQQLTCNVAGTKVEWQLVALRYQLLVESFDITIRLYTKALSQ